MSTPTPTVLTSLPVVPAAAQGLGRGIDYEVFMDCVHCGLCLGSCPTYAETGNENDSPRGRIYLMRSVIDGQLALDETVKGHLDLCLEQPGVIEARVSTEKPDVYRDCRVGYEARRRVSR